MHFHLNDFFFLMHTYLVKLVQDSRQYKFAPTGERYYNKRSWLTWSHRKLRNTKPNYYKVILQLTFYS